MIVFFLQKLKEHKKDKKDKLKKKKEKKEKHRDKGEKVKEKKDKSEKKDKLEKLKEKKEKKEKRKEKEAMKKIAVSKKVIDEISMYNFRNNQYFAVSLDFFFQKEEKIEGIPKLTFKIETGGGSPRALTPDSALTKKM